MRHILWGLALVSPAVLAQGPPLPTPPPPEKYNPVPPQFRGQPVNPSWSGSGLIQSGTAPQPNFRPIGNPPAVETPKAPELLPPAPLPAPVLAPPLAAKPQAAAPMAPQPANVAAPSVVVEKRCPESVNAGTPLAYEIFVRNLGQTPVQLVRIEEELPPGTKFVSSDPPAEATAERLTWMIGQIEAGTEKRIRVEVHPFADGEYRSAATVTFSASAAMRTQVVRPRLNVTMSGPDQVQTGDVVPLNIQVSNPGSGPANGVILRVKLPAGLTHPGGSHIEAELGTLPPGDNKTIPLRVTASLGGIQAAEVTATGDGNLEATARTQATVMQPMLQMRRGALTKVMFKSEFSEEYEITNPGNAPATNVTLTEVLPPGLEFLGASDGATYDAVSRAVVWRLGTQAPGAVRRVVLKAKATGVGDQPTRAVAVAERGVETKADGSVTVEGIPALALEVVDLEDPVEVGGELTYEIRVVNQGSCPCTGIKIVCDVPEGLQPTEAGGPTQFRTQANQVVFEALPKLATKADTVFRVKVKGLQPGDYRFKVQMTCDQMRLPVNKEESSRVYKN